MEPHLKRDQMAIHNNKTESKTLTSIYCEYKISHLYITFTKIHFILEIQAHKFHHVQRTTAVHPSNTQKLLYFFFFFSEDSFFSIILFKENVYILTHYIFFVFQIMADSFQFALLVLASDITGQ